MTAGFFKTPLMGVTVAAVALKRTRCAGVADLVGLASILGIDI
jgi:hypothetical protein